MKWIFVLAPATLILVAGCIVAAKQQMQPEITFRNTNPAAEKAMLAKRIEADRLADASRSAILRGHYAEAEALCQRSLAIDQADPWAWLALAEVREHLGKYDAALDAYRTLIHSPGWGANIANDPTTSMRYVLALTRKGQRAEAVTVYEKALHDFEQIHGRPLLDVHFDPTVGTTGPLEAAAHLLLGTCEPSFQPSVPTEQRQHLAAAVRLEPHWALAQYSYGRALERAGKKTEALAAYHRAAALAEGDLKTKAQDAYAKLAGATVSASPTGR